MIKKFFLFTAILAAFTLSSCSDPKPTSELEAKCEALMEKYPNYESNEMAAKSLNDSVAAYCESFVGKEASLLKGIEFEFVKTFDNEQKGTHPALFKGRGFCEIDAKGGKTKYIISSPSVLVLGTLSDEQTATLDSNQKYSISGIVHAWDGDNMLGTHTVMTHSDISFGTFIMETINVDVIDAK